MVVPLYLKWCQEIFLIARRVVVYLSDQSDPNPLSRCGSSGGKGEWSCGGNFGMAIATINPSTGKTLKTFEPLSEREIEQKIARAEQTFSEFHRLSFAQRAQMMLKAADILESEKKELAKLMTTEMGKTFRSAVDEAVKCAWVCRYYAE